MAASKSCEPIPITRDCPIACLGLSRHASEALRRDASEPKTVADVVRLWERDALRNVRGVGARRREEIGAALRAAGFLDHQHRHRGCR